MKRITTALVLAAAVTANGLYAHATASVAHAHPKFKSATATYELADGTVVMWQAEEDAARPDADKTSYTVTIVQAEPKPVTYSLLTLGVQAILHDNIVVSAKPETGDVAFAAPGEMATTVKPLPLFIPRTGIKADPEAPLQEKLDGSRIWFVSFSSKVCVLQVKAANRKVYGVTRWAKTDGSPGDGHDTVPPKNPPD